MKKSLMTLFVVAALLSCNKEPGSGGNSSITGKLNGMVTNSEDPEYEVTTVIVPIQTGETAIDDGDFWVINAAGGNQYYVWYDNTNNPLSTDPMIPGRIGIDVEFNFSQSSATIASNTALRFQQIAAADFTVTVDNDILTITNTEFGQVADADNMNSPFAIDVQNQGAGGSSGGTEGPIVEERVYLIYGGEDFYSEDVRTDDQGRYQFRGLRKGNYTIYSFSKNASSGILERVEVEAEITKNKTVVEAPELYVIK